MVPVPKNQAGKLAPQENNPVAALSGMMDRSCEVGGASDGWVKPHKVMVLLLRPSNQAANQPTNQQTTMYLPTGKFPLKIS